MKTINLIILLSAVLTFFSCEESADIRIQNNISNVKLTDIQWGNIYIAAELLPGETSERYKIDNYTVDLPASYTIAFKMTAKGKTVYLETNESFSLDDGDDLIIELDDNTEVSNPNE